MFNVAVLEVESQTEYSPPTIVAAARSLAIHLREQPRDRFSSPARLAAQFGVESGIVCSVLEGVRQSSHTRAKQSGEWRTQLVAGIKSVNQAIRDLTDAPLRFLWFSSLMVCLTGLLPLSLTHFSGVIKFVGWTSLSLELSAYFILHLVCVWRAGKSRFAWISAGVSVVAITTLAIAAGFPWHSLTGPEGWADVSVLYIVSCVLAFVSFVMLGLVLTLVAIVGGYIRVWQIDRKSRTLTRQEAIQRLLELQARVVHAAPESKSRSGFRRLRTRFRQHAQSLCLGAGAAFGLAGLLLPAHQVDNLGLFAAVSTFSIGVMAPGPGTSLVFGLAFGFAEYSLPWLRTHSVETALVGLSHVMSRGVLAWSVSFVAFVYEVTSRQNRLEQNEVNALVEELVRVEWKLLEAANWVTALCVDAAGSTRMKMGVDPLMVEYSFRAYQAWIARTVSEDQGTVQATAGDGAIVSFRDAAQALRAAKRLQRGLIEFNLTENQIGVPFRVRIGIHRGQLRGALHEVEFTNVIDIAAHIEKISPVGGIAMSEGAFFEARQSRPDEKAFALAEPVDGQTVYVIQNATEDV